MQSAEEEIKTVLVAPVKPKRHTFTDEERRRGARIARDNDTRTPEDYSKMGKKGGANNVAGGNMYKLTADDNRRGQAKGVETRRLRKLEKEAEAAARVNEIMAALRSSTL